MKKSGKNISPTDFMNIAYEEMLKSVKDNDYEKESPKVGAVIVFEQDGEIYYESAHRGHTRDGHHAEESLLDDLNKDVDFKNAEMYITLEPCVPGVRSKGVISCAERIVNARVAKVYIGMFDPNPKIKNKGAIFLLKNNVAVELFEPLIRKKIEVANSSFINHSFSDIDYDKLEEDILPQLSEEALKFYSESIDLDISEGYGYLWNHLLSNKLIYKNNKKYYITDECGIAFGNNTKEYCVGALIQLFVNFSKENVLNKTGKNLEIREEYSGPMILITQKLKEWLKKHFFLNQNRAEESIDYIVPYEAIKEAVVNAVAHREYGANGSYTYIRIKDYSLVVQNPCNINSRRLENIIKLKAKSIPTNARLTELFIGTQMMNRSGSGMETFSKMFPTPSYEYDGDYLSLTFPYSIENAFKLFEEHHPNISFDEFRVYEYIKKKGVITRAQIESIFNLTEKTANNRLNKLDKEGLIIKISAGRSTKYELK